MTNQTETHAAAAPECFCRDLGSHITALFGLRSDEARQHLRNARIEMLKAVRSVIDARIAELSRTPERGTQVPIE